MTIALILLMTVNLAAAEIAEDPVYREKMPEMMEACLEAAVDQERVTQTDTDHKYICDGHPAEELWQFLEAANIPSYEQQADAGTWLSREFPLGGCFKLLSNDDGSDANGLSCTLWIPRLLEKPE